VGRLKVVDAQGQPQWLVVLGEFNANVYLAKNGLTARPTPQFPTCLWEISPKPSAQDGHLHRREWENE
jgi:hypothetical protein